MQASLNNFDQVADLLVSHPDIDLNNTNYSGTMPNRDLQFLGRFLLTIFKSGNVILLPPFPIAKKKM